MKEINSLAIESLKILKEKKPLVHNITNYVVMNWTANVLLSMGASPVMAHAVEEVEEMTGIASSLVLNIGTLSENWIKAMLLAGKKANDIGIPIILDPVGSGATKFRTETCLKLVKNLKISVIRGNASEVLSLSANSIKTKGVDSLHSGEDALEKAKFFSMDNKCITAITGKIDFITDGSKAAKVFNGDPMLSMITGTGCAATSVIAAFLAVIKDPFIASVIGLSFFGIAGELAVKKSKLPGSFMIALIDALNVIDGKMFTKKMKVEL